MGGCSFWSEIDAAEFAIRTANAYPAVTMLTIAVEHWVGSSAVLLGVVTPDRADYDFGFVILGRDEHGRYRAIDPNCSHATRDEAREVMLDAMDDVIESGATVFPQGRLQ